jgi:hypothetical protein
MSYIFNKENDQVTLSYNENRLLLLKVQQEYTMDPTKDPKHKSEDRRVKNELRCEPVISPVPRRNPVGCKVTNLDSNGWRNWSITCDPFAVIFPTREGEKISLKDLFPDDVKDGMAGKVKKSDKQIHESTMSVKMRQLIRSIKDLLLAPFRKFDFDLLIPRVEAPHPVEEKGEKRDFIYTLTYPGTASTKCVVVFTGEKENQGFVIGSEPSLKWAELSLKLFSRDDDSSDDRKKKLVIRIFQRDADLYIIPFQKDYNGGEKAHTVKITENEIANIVPKKSWKTAVRRIPLVARKLNPEQPRFMLQMGIKDPDGKAKIDHFLDQRLLDAIDKFQIELGPGNIIHLFGTNEAGFDNLFPDYSIDPGLGGKEGLKKLVEYIHKKNLLTSHHFNPRIASAKWLKEIRNWWRYRKAVLRDRNGKPWEEMYKKNLYYVMNPSHDKWQKYCIEWVRYFEDIGFDYIELDQISYQRNIVNPNDDIGTGFQDMINIADKGPAHVWTEGVSDIFKLPPGAWFQMLPRTRHEKWVENNENRRGYIGEQRPQFYRSLKPNTLISVQIVMDTPNVEDKLKNIPKQLKKARDLKAVVLDLELGFFNEDNEIYPLEQTLEAIRKFATDDKLKESKEYKATIKWLNSWLFKPKSEPSAKQR